MPNFKYNSGDKIGPNNIVMKERIKRDGHHWICSFICPYCNSVFRAYLDHISGGLIKSCGCHQYNHRYKDLRNLTFGRLTVLDEPPIIQNGIVKWKCQCNCERHSEIYVLSSNLTKDNTKSCECLKSKGEEKISCLLKSLCVSFQTEYIFSDCINPKTSYPLKFDFYLPDYNTCIEYDGEQHFNIGWGGKEQLKNNQYRDSIKNQYCKDNNIKLVRIPYYNYDILNEKYLYSQIISDTIKE